MALNQLCLDILIERNKLDNAKQADGYEKI